MARYAYDRLTALDNSFLVLESSNAYMHVASTQIHEAGPLRNAYGGIDADTIKRRIEALLHLIPRYRQKLAWIPLQSHAVWVDDARFNIDYHVRHTSLPRPGTTEQLMRLSARIMQQHLDRRRPLWEIWIVEGLEGGDRFAIISKTHHCMIDGMSGVDIMRVLMSPDPDHEDHDKPAYIPRAIPSATELLLREGLRWASLPFRVASGLGALIGEVQDVRRRAITAARSVGQTVGASLRPASATPLNDEIGPHRRFTWLTMDLAEIKKVRRALGGSLNDVVLTVVTGAVRRFLRRRQVDPSGLDFRVLAPVSVRTENERGALGNRVSAWVVELPLDEPDPIRQIERIGTRTSALKSSRGALGAEVLSQVAEWTPSTLLSLAGRNVTRLLPFNMVVTNVPGPQIPMYLFGARMVEAFPHVPLIDNLGLGIALLSYDGKLCWGFNADYDLVPDLGAFVKGISAAYEELRGLAAERIGRGAPVSITPPRAAEVSVASPPPTEGGRPRGDLPHGH
jgi:WS/DGAT/MGAT family acyltransferase